MTRGTWTGYDDVSLGAGVTSTARRGGDGETFTPSPKPATPGYVPNVCRPGFGFNSATGQCCAMDNTVAQWLHDNGYGAAQCFAFGQEPVIAAVPEGTDLGLIAYERVSSTTPAGTHVTAANGLIKGVVQAGGYVAWDWNHIGVAGMNCSGEIACNEEGQRQLAGLWGSQFPADDHGYCKGSEYPLPGYASFAQVPLVPCVPKKYQNPVAATATGLPGGVSGADYVATYQALLDTQHARGFSADTIALFAAGKQSFVRFGNLSQTGNHPEDTVNGQHGRWDLSGWNVHYGTNTDGKLLVVNLPDFYPDGGISLWDGLQAAFPLIVLAVKGAEALGELGLEIFRAVLCNPVGKALAAAGVGVATSSPQGAAGTVAALTTLCALAGSNGGTTAPLPCPAGQTRGSDGFCTGGNGGWIALGVAAAAALAGWFAFGKPKK